MTNRFATPVACAATVILLIGACSDDGPTTLAKGEDVELVGDADFAGQTLNISAEEEDGEVTGEVRFSDPSGEVVVTVECADTDTDGVVILGGTITDSDDYSGRAALVIREGDPDSAAVSVELPLPEGDVAAGSCGDYLESVAADVLADDAGFVDVEAGDDIETG